MLLVVLLLTTAESGSMKYFIDFLIDEPNICELSLLLLLLISLISARS